MTAVIFLLSCNTETETCIIPCSLKYKQLIHFKYRRCESRKRRGNPENTVATGRYL